MSSITISKNYLYQILFAVCVGVTYLNNYELTFVVWSTVILFTLRRKYSLTLIHYVLPYIAILIVAITSFEIGALAETTILTFPPNLCLILLKIIVSHNQ